jgi:PIN domain nuclease of toxin-antitoxin system
LKFLIDTSCWLWSLSNPEHLNSSARDLLADPSKALFLSAASSWEIAIKVALGKLQLPESPERYIPGRMAAFSISGMAVEHAHALRVSSLPQHHRDPFDRILVAQAQVEGMTLLTADRAFEPYDIEIIWAV